MTAGRFRQVLVGWDGSVSAAEALNAAAAIAGGDGGHVVALAVLKATPRFEAADDDDVSARAAISNLADEQFERARQMAPQGVRMSLRIVENERIGPTVCDYATEHGFDLLVVGRHGDGGVLHPRLGRVAKAAVQNCAIPVLLV